MLRDHGAQACNRSAYPLVAPPDDTLIGGVSDNVDDTREKMMKRLVGGATLGIAVLTAGCADDASVASMNLSKAADMFEIDRRIVFYNGITDGYILTIEGRCSINATSDQLEVTCKTGSSQFKKHFLGISDNVTYFAEQLDSVKASVYNYRVIFKPEVIVPDIDLQTSQEE